MIKLMSTDMIVQELVERVGPVILHLDYLTNACIVAVMIDEASNDPDPNNDRPVPRLEYQVSDGLPGHRSSSHDLDTYEEAKAALTKVIKIAKDMCTPYIRDRR